MHAFCDSRYRIRLLGLAFALLLLAAMCHAQVEDAKIDAGTDPELIIQPREIAPLPILQAQKTTLQKTADTLAARIHDIDTKPETVISTQITELDKHIAACPDRKVPDGLTSMNQHLLQLKYAIVDNPGKFLSDERAKAITSQTRINATLATVESDIAAKEGAK